MNDARDTLSIESIHWTYVNTETMVKSYCEVDGGWIFVTKLSEWIFAFSVVSLYNTIPSFLDERNPSGLQENDSTDNYKWSGPVHLEKDDASSSILSNGVLNKEED